MRLRAREIGRRITSLVSFGASYGAGAGEQPPSDDQRPGALGADGNVHRVKRVMGAVGRPSRYDRRPAVSGGYARLARITSKGSTMTISGRVKPRRCMVVRGAVHPGASERASPRSAGARGMREATETQRPQLPITCPLSGL